MCRPRLRSLCVALVLVGSGAGPLPRAAADDPLRELLAAYATRPQDYPSGPGFARPDLSVPFRWHGYHDGAVERHADARMALQTDPYNPLEGEGARTDPGSPVQWRFVPDHATEGKQALRVDFPAAAIRQGKAAVRIKGLAGPQVGLGYPWDRPPACCYGPHYRWLHVDAFNPAAEDVRVRFCGVPLVVGPGRRTLAVKTADAVERGYGGVFDYLTVEVVAPARDVTLYLDHARVVQEVPDVIRRRGRLFQFAGRAGPKAAPLLAPGFTAVDADTVYSPERGFGWTLPPKKRRTQGHSFRSLEHGILWGRCEAPDAPFRVDLPNGRYGVYLLAAPSHGYDWARGGRVRLNGADAVFLAPRTPAEVRRLALGGEAVDYRPGLCLWEALVRPPYYPPTLPVYADVTDGHLRAEFPPAVSLHALLIFPAAEREAALKEIGRLNYLLAESWDVSHPWVRGGYADRVRYIGLHDEMLRPETIPERLRALRLTARDFERGFVLFRRGLAEAVYPGTVPAPAEVAFGELRGAAAPGQRECLTLGILPLRAVKGLQLSVGDLVAGDKKTRILASRIDVRFARYHQKTMQFGHHNHDYNYAEHYLVRRPTVDVFPAAARRAYLDVAVPADARPGSYAGEVTVAAEDGAVLARVPLVIEVLLLELLDPPVYLASSLDEPRLREYGFNTFRTSYDRAAQHGYRAYLANLGHLAQPFKGKLIGWSNVAANKEWLRPLVEAGRAGRGPRGFFGGPAPGTHTSPKAEAVAREFFAGVSADLPAADLLGVTASAFYFRLGKKGFQVPHEWIVLAGPATPDEPELLDAARRSGKPFWYIDGVRHAKEQAGRFTFGVWLWRVGAAGRYTTLEAALQYGYGTARESYSWEPYYTLLDVTTCNVDRALKESLTDGELNPCRDLILLRAGIDDYRYLHTLDALLARAGKADAAVRAAAERFRAGLWADVAPDLARYYEARSGAYGENWYPLPGNPWNTSRFEEVRREAGRHILALRQTAGR